MIDLPKTLELILAICALVGVVWKIFQAFDKIERRMELHIQDSQNKQELTTLNLNQLNEKIEHKFRRLLAGQQDIQQYLAKNGSFIVRQYYDPADERGREKE